MNPQFTHTAFGLDPIVAGKAINKGLMSLLEKLKDCNKILGENYPIYPEDFQGGEK